MQDFYTRKTSVLSAVERTIKTAFLEKGKYCVEEDLLFEVNRMTGFCMVVKKHIQALIKNGLVERVFNEEGKNLLKWTGKDEPVPETKK